MVIGWYLYLFIRFYLLHFNEIFKPFTFGGFLVFSSCVKNLYYTICHIITEMVYEH